MVSKPKRTVEGWTFVKPVLAGAQSRIRCLPFFRTKKSAEKVANRWNYFGRVDVVRATLTLKPPPRRKGERK